MNTNILYSLFEQVKVVPITLMCGVLCLTPLKALKNWPSDILWCSEYNVFQIVLGIIMTAEKLWGT